MARRRGRALRRDPIDQRTEDIFQTALPWQQPHNEPQRDPLLSTLSSTDYNRAHMHGAARYELKDEEVVLRGSELRPQAFVRNLIRSYSYLADRDVVEHSDHTDFQTFESAPSDASSEPPLESPCVRKKMRSAATSEHRECDFNPSHVTRFLVTDPNEAIHRSPGQGEYVAGSSQAVRDVLSSALTIQPKGHIMKGYIAKPGIATSKADGEVLYLGEAISPKRRLPRHEWTEQELEALCVLRRWYTNTAGDCARIMNKLFEKELILRQQPEFHKTMVDAQWIAGLMQHPIRVAVCFNTSFDDSSGKFKAVRRRLAIAAREVNIQLLERKVESDAIARMRRRAKVKMPVRQNVTIRKRSKTSRDADADDRRQTTLHEHNAVAPVAKRLHKMRQRTLKGPQSTHHTLFDTVPAIEQEIATLNLEDASVSIALTGILQSQDSNGRANRGSAVFPQTMPWKEMPSLFFRCYDEDSAGINSPELFRAGFFHADDGIVPHPLEAGHALFPFFTVNHLWRRKSASPFISVTGSLLWAIHKAQQSFAQGKRPYIAVIDANLAARDDRAFYVNDMIAEQRRNGNLKGPLQTMRYRGTQEWFIWGEVSQEAIVYVVSFAHLRDLANALPDVKSVLRLDDLNPNHRISSIREVFLASPVALDVHVSAALGSIVAAFGVSPTSNEGHLVKMVSDLIQGWVVIVNQDSQAAVASERICAAFAGALKFFANRIEIEPLPQDWEGRLQEAFVRGIITGSQWDEQVRKHQKSLGSRQ